MPPFTHLHCHSYFSLLDGAAPPKELCQRAAELGMTAVAVTDHNTLAGAVRFFQAAQQAGIKPIIGVEFTVELVTGNCLVSRHSNASLPSFSLPPLLPPGNAGVQRLGDPRPDTTHDYTRCAHLVLLAEDNEGYSNLCRLVTCAHLGKARHSGPFSADYQQIDRKKPILSQQHLREYASHLICLSGCEKGEIPRLVAAGHWRQALAVADYYRQLFGEDRFYIEIQNNLLPPPQRYLRYKLQTLSQQLGAPLVATNNVHYVERTYARAQDVLVCIRVLQTVNEYHPDRKVNAEYGLKSPHEMAALFSDQLNALRNAYEISQRCHWTLDLETFHFPKFDLDTIGQWDEQERQRQAERMGHGAGLPPDPLPIGEGEGPLFSSPAGTAAQGPETTVPPLPPREGDQGVGQTDASSFLRHLCYTAAEKLYPQITDQVRHRLEHELKVIHDQGLCDYFLIVWDICRFARSRGILTTGRGSAGDSIVSYLLGITSVDPLAHELLFERFLNPERRQMPDIDVDFDSRRRDEVNAYIYRRYGPERVAAVCTVNTFRARSAVREVGKALGMDEQELGVIAETLPHVRAADIAEAAQRFPEVREAHINLSDKTLLLELCEQISGFPRHLSVHVGGLLIGAEPLTNMVPLRLAQKGIVIAEFDKDDVEALGLVKMDILGLRVHTALSDCLELIQQRTRQRIDLDAIPLDDEKTFELLRSTHTIGLFQLESPGQRNLLGRAQPREFEEVIANISLFRPGPVQSDMIHPYLRRKHGQEPVVYPHPSLEPILRRTYGVLIYQEQVLEIAAAIAGFTLAEADKLRRLMTSDRSKEEMMSLGDTFIQRAMERGVERAVAEEVFRQISGFAAYGFCKAHAACFAKIAYQTAWLKAHYPAEFMAGILSAQPMGFYPPRTIAEEAKRLGCQILPPCVNRSEDRFTVEQNENSSYPAIRVGLRLLRGMTDTALRSILEARQRDGPFESLQDFRERTRVPRPILENLILARAFEFTGRTEQELLWTKNGDSPYFPDIQETAPVLRVALDLNICHLSTTLNPFSFWRQRMVELGVTPSTDLYQCKDGDHVRVAGIVVARARPPTRSGKTAIFICLEDEFGLIDVAVFEECYQRCGRALYASPVLCVEGKLTRLGELDLSVTAHEVIGLGSWRDFDTNRRTPRPLTPARRKLTPLHSPGKMQPQTANDIRHIENRLMHTWEPRPNPKVGERRG